MASTPSSSALSAVLRCRGNIWARNPPTRRPATSAHSLGVAPRGGSRAWWALLQGERVSVGRRPAAAPVKAAKALGEKDSGEIGEPCRSELSRIRGDAHAAAPGARNAPAARRRPTSSLPGIGPCAISATNPVIKRKTRATHPHTVVLVKDAGVLKVSITSKCLLEGAVRRPSLVSTGWSAVRRACWPLAALVSDFALVKLGFLGRDDDTLRDDAAQANGQVRDPAEPNPGEQSPNFGQSITEDRAESPRPQ